MYQVGDYLVYGFEGVCHVDEVGHPKISGSNREKLYYSLTPYSHKGTIYTPVDSKVFMRPVISNQTMAQLLAALPSLPVCDNVPADSRASSQYYQDLLRTHDCEKVLQVFKTLYLKQRALAGAKKTVSATDMRCWKQAEDMLTNEFGFLSNQSPAEISSTLKSLIDDGAATA